MALVKKCEFTKCAYNTDRICHAKAITVGGDEACPMCDTAVRAHTHAGVGDIQGSVGACKVDTCRFNEFLECTAHSVTIKEHDGHAECGTFENGPALPDNY